MPKAPKHIFFRFLLLVGMIVPIGVSAQSWMPGYNYRKSMTINKALVSGTVNLIDFPVLISMTDPDLVYLSGQCNANKISSAAGLDISFGTAASPGTPLKFQIDSYDAATGSLKCWVNIPVLSASGNTAASTMIYLYYGSNTFQDPLGSNAIGTWTSLTKVWHMNLDAAPASSMNAKYNTAAEMARGTGVMNTANFVAGKIGSSLKLNGNNESMNAARDTSTIFTISAWIKMNRVDVEQVLLSNDSTGVGGYTVKINSSGKVTFDIKRGTSSIVSSSSAGTALLVNQWYLVAISRDGKGKTIYINGKVASSIARIEGIGTGGRLSIGRGKQNDRFFAGMIDELRISDKVKTLEWLTTEYNNQNDAAAFCTIGKEEKNPAPTTTGYLFTAVSNDNWSDPANWNLGRVPEPFANVVVKAHSKVTIRDAAETRLNQLTLEDGASLTVQNTQLQVCKMQLDPNASLLVPGNMGVQFNGDVLNNGTISTGETMGTLAFSGNQASTGVAGTGSMRVFHLQMNEAGSTNQVILNQPVVVTGTLDLIAGILNSNGNLTLAAAQTQAASILPIGSPVTASVIGDVVVEKYVEGSFPSPATARGWRLWSSPVYTSNLNGSPEYNLNSIKNAVFVTGKGGAVNGFDDSPLNGNTIFTHDQSLVGNLAQKYIPIPAMSAQIPLGTGVYVYSRGSRQSPDALNKQLLNPPFINPEPYTIRYTGKLFSGDLKVLVNSRNRKEPGDGFNLLGNPYASAIRWGSLIKENTTAFVWMFNPLNNSYDVSDDPEYRIPSASGFFVKVAAGMSTGSVTFREEAKIATSLGSQSTALSSLAETTRLSATSLTPATMSSSLPVASLNRKLQAVISRGAFTQRYILKLDPAGSDEITDADALSLADGYVNIAGLSADKQKLMIDSRSLVDRQATVALYVKGWSTGSYDLQFSGFESFQPEDSVVLTDNYLQSSTLLSPSNNHYPFQIDAQVAETEGFDRFSLSIHIALQHREAPATLQDNGAQIRVYPNPFTDVITLNTAATFPNDLQVIIRDLMGQQVLTRDINTVEDSNSITVNAGMLTKGLYIIELRDKKLNKRLKTAKIIKL